MSDFFVEQQWNLKVVFNRSFCHGNYENVKFYRLTKYFISIFSLTKFQLVSCNLPLAMIWQMTYPHKLPKLCSATLKGLYHQLHILGSLKSQLRAKQIFLPSIRAIFVWPWNKNARTKQKQQTNENRAIWLAYRTNTKARGFWLVKRTLGWKNFTPENFLEITQYFALTSYCNTIGQSNNVFSILGFSPAGKRRGHVLIF